MPEQPQYLARHNKVWQNIKTGDILTDKITLKDGEKLTEYRQIDKPKEKPQVEKKGKRDKLDFSFTDNSEGGTY